MPDFTSSEMKNISKSPILEKSQALTFHLKTETSFASLQVNTVKNLYWTFKIHIPCCSLTSCAVNFILDAKVAKRLYWVTFKLHRQNPGQEQISEQVPDRGRQEEGVHM